MKDILAVTAFVLSLLAMATFAIALSVTHGWVFWADTTGAVVGYALTMWHFGPVARIVYRWRSRR